MRDQLALTTAELQQLAIACSDRTVSVRPSPAVRSVGTRKRTEWRAFLVIRKVVALSAHVTRPALQALTTLT